ncbi:MAG: DUF4395 domain-containing protein [Actinomycetota bacterium]|jgi:hypothetical protein|nr:DUF4395 domain-containing protein [Actinomycetota bacterium]MDA2948405.1 DUF4395 domain-containing protein [Actinomycetota bacterium]MDA2990360.1 DUF4395 domain-containing protein [Actinomycetota bacterium]
MSTSTTAPAAPAEIDARVSRFTATVTAAVLATALAVATVNPPVAAAILAVQAVIFGIGAVRGPLQHPYGRAFDSLIAPRLGPAAKLDAVAQVRFAQMLGFFFCVVGATGFALGAPMIGWISAGFALIAAVMRAVFGICLGKGPYMLVCRLRGEVPACCQNK